MKNKTTNTLESSAGREKKKKYFLKRSRSEVSIWFVLRTLQLASAPRNAKNNSLAYPKSLWAGRRVHKVTSPRVSGAPSRHQEL